MTRTRVWAACLLGLVAVSLVYVRARRRPAPAPLYDLADRLWLAERSSPREFLWFGTPGAAAHVADGLYWELDGSAWAWAVRRPAPELVFIWPEPEARTAILDLEPSPGLDTQGLSLLLNGTPVGTLDLPPRRARHRVGLPAAAQRRGENRLRLAFARSAPLAAGDVREYAARLFSVSIGRVDDVALDDLLGREAPPLFGTGQDDLGRVLTMVAPGSASFVFALPERAALEFTPELHPVARRVGQPVSFSVTLASEGVQPREIWRRTVSPDEAPEGVTLALGGEAGKLVRVTLHAGGGEGQRYLWAVWRAPRIIGTRRQGDLLPVPYDRKSGRRGEGLRRGLSAAGVLLVILDAARAGHFGCYGYQRGTTPEIDRIAAEGVVFDRAYTTAVSTLGGMSSIWTSQHPDAHHRGHLFLEPLPADRPTLAEWLSARGVPTFGAVANAMAGRLMRLDRGFSIFREIYDDRHFGSRAEVFRRRAYDWFEGARDRRFFAYLHFREPHHPFDPPDRFLTLFGPNEPLSAEQRMEGDWVEAVNEGSVRPSPAEIEHLMRAYDGNLAYVDREVGALRAHLERLGLWERLLVIVAADHGEQLYEDGYIGHSAQVREESARVPLILRFPSGSGPRGLRVGGLVDHSDLAPTIAEVFGASPSEGVGPSFHGRSLLPMVDGVAGKAAVLVRSVWERPVYALVSQDAKLIYDTRTGRERLYRLQSDPGERRDLAPSEALETAFLRQSLHAWLARLMALPVAPADGAAPRPEDCSGMTREQCLNLCALGYIECDGCASCP